MVSVLLHRDPLRDIVDHCRSDITGFPVLCERARPLAGHEEVIERRIVSESRLLRSREAGFPESKVFHGDLEITLALKEKQGNLEPRGLYDGVVVLQIEKVNDRQPEERRRILHVWIEMPDQFHLAFQHFELS